MRLTLILTLLFFSLCATAEAHTPVLVTQESLNDVTVIEAPEVSHAYYGELTGFPHTYLITVSEPFELFAQILIPDTGEGSRNVSGLIVKEQDGGARVTEIARLRAQDGTWEEWYEPFAGDRYRIGPSYTASLEGGVYRIEVSTPDNLEKYVLVVGEEEDPFALGYFETIRRIAGVKEFFGKSQFRVLESPLVFVPLLMLVAIGGGVRYVLYRKRRVSA